MPVASSAPSARRHRPPICLATSADGWWRRHRRTSSGRATSAPIARKVTPIAPHGGPAMGTLVLPIGAACVAVWTADSRSSIAGPSAGAGAAVAGGRFALVRRARCRGGFVLTRRQARVSLGAGCAAPWRRLERDPAEAVEPDLRPGVGVAAEHRAGAVALVEAVCVADGHPRRDAERPGHRRERAGELLAVADPLAEERLDGAVAVPGGHVEAVAKLRLEPVLQRQHGVVVRRRALGDRRRGGRDRRREVIGQAQVDRVGRLRAAGAAQHVGGEVGHRRDDVDAIAGLEVAIGAHERRRLGVPLQALAGRRHRLGGGGTSRPRSAAITTSWWFSRRGRSGIRQTRRPARRSPARAGSTSIRRSSPGRSPASTTVPSPARRTARCRRG